MHSNSEMAAAAGPPAGEPLPAAADPIQNQKSKIKNPLPCRRRRGKVARLPKQVRTRINQALDDGLPYRQITHDLGEHGKNLTEDDIRRWKTGGYQDYLREQLLIDQCQARITAAFELLSQRSQIKAFQATQQIAAAQICEVAADLGADTLRQALVANPLNYFRMLNSFARLTAGGLKCERHLADEAQRSAARQKPSAKRGISRKSVKQMQSKLNLM